MKANRKVTVAATGALAVAALTGIFAGSANAMTVSGGISNSSTQAHIVLAGTQVGDLYEHAGTHECKGHNECKGHGGCKSGDNGCKGKNSCKGKGGCKSGH